MENFKFAGQAGWQVLFWGLALGAGLPAVFALGIRSLAYGAPSGTTTVGDHTPHPLARVAAYVCFALVVLGIALGIMFIVVTGFGKVLDFSHGYPTIIAKS